MRSGFCAATILLCILFAASPARSSGPMVPDSARKALGESLTRVSAFSAQPRPRQLCGEILRQRTSRLDPGEFLNQSDLKSIRLHPFDDLSLTALRREKQSDGKGFLLWTGEIEGVEGGRFVLVVRNGFLFASAYLPSSIIQIRPVDPQSRNNSRNYIVRELACAWTGGPAARSAGMTLDSMRMVELVNLERKADGLPALEYNGQLTEAARRHAMDMARHDSISHELSDGRQFYQNVFGSGYPVSEVGENLAAGIATPEETFECLLSSPDHRSNIMNSDFKQIGASDVVNTQSGYRYFWAQEFGAASGAKTMRLSAAR